MEIEIVKFFNRLGRGKVDGMTDFLSRVRYLFAFWAVVSAVAIFFGGENRVTIFAALAVVTAEHFLFSEGIIKHLLTKIWGIRKRPYLVDSSIIPIGRQFSDSSFPSSHMTSALAMFTVLIYFFPVIWPASLALVLLIAFTRLHNGMHYLSDVLVGTILGIGYGALGIYVSKIIV